MQLISATDADLVGTFDADITYSIEDTTSVFGIEPKTGDVFKIILKQDTCTLYVYISGISLWYIRPGDHNFANILSFDICILIVKITQEAVY